jgi:serine/threonine-protein kinase
MPSPPDAAAPDPDATHLSGAPAGRPRIAGYLIERPLASGASGTVYRALDERLGRHVALKVLKDTAFPHARERFLREVRLIAGLHHPNVVLLYGAGEDTGVAWAAMELMPGSLSQELHRAGRLSADDIRSITRDVCLGLDAVWKRGIVHRDIKPSNLLRSADGVVKVADFGLAKDLSLELNLTAADVVLGTPWYVSPEQAAGKAVGVAADLYSLGATLYHLAAGHPPFESSNALDVIVRHAIEPVPPLPADVPESITRLIMWLLEKDPSKRPADYQAVLALLDGDAPEADVVSPASPSAGERGDGVSSSVVAAARAALQMGRGKRARSLLEPVVEARETGWVQAGFLLATAMEESHAPTEARSVLEAIAQHAKGAEDRALALWNLGRLAEKESAAAMDRAIEIYGRIAEVSTTRFPKSLLEARIARLRGRQADRKSSTSSS